MADTDFSSGAGAVWVRERRARRGTPPLTRERIVREAIALLDEEGVERLTMRRLAERLGNGPTTLYWHVETKDDVLDLALDAIFAEVEPPGLGASWRAAVTTLLRQWRAVMLRHPWSAALLERPMLGPNVLSRTEALYRALLDAGFTGSRLTAAVHSLANYLVGSALAEARRRSLPAAARLDGLRDRYPALAGHGHLDDHDWAAVFEQGLTFLLDGMSGD